ncbi:MAG: multidrug efflux SMR transporter [Gammaproteobacteria bacterium]
MQHWFILAIAIVLEVAGTTSLKLSDGLSRLTPTLCMALFYIASVGALALAVKKIEVSIAYAVWAGAGTALIAVIGILYFNESANLVKVVSILLIITGVVGLNLSSIKL